MFASKAENLFKGPDRKLNLLEKSQLFGKKNPTQSHKTIHPCFMDHNNEEDVELKLK